MVKDNHCGRNVPWQIQSFLLHTLLSNTVLLDTAPDNVDQLPGISSEPNFQKGTGIDYL